MILLETTTKKRRIGIIGGTFNPIHLGHLMIAEVAYEEFELEQVIFVPTHISPHKFHDVISAYHRYAMTAAAVEDNPHFTISDVEIKRDGYSYTIDTIRYFQEQMGPDVEFYFIAGTDTIELLPSWHYIDELLQLCHFIGAMRPDAKEMVDSVLEFFGEKAIGRIHLLQVPEMKLSATYLRERLRAGKTVRYMLPKCVVDYITNNNIYTDVDSTSVLHTEHTN